MRDLVRVFCIGVLVGAAPLCGQTGEAEVRSIETIKSLDEKTTSIRIVAPLGDGVLAALKQMPWLEELVIERCENVTGAGLVRLAGHPSLRAVSIRECPNVGDRAISGLAAFPELRSVTLAGLPISNAGVSKLLGPRLRELSLESCRGVTKGIVRQLARMPLTRLSLVDLGLTDHSLAPMVKMTSLESLSLGDNPRLTSVTCRIVARLPHLRHLDLRGSQVDKLGVEMLSRLGYLRSLDLSGCENIKSTGFMSLGGHERLEELRVRGTKIHDESLEALAKLEHLARLDLSGCDRISDRGLMFVATMHSLQELSLDDSRVSDQWLEGLVHCGKLEILSLSGARRITDRGLRLLPQLATLKRLDLTRCPRISKAGIATLRKALSGCEVVTAGADQPAAPRRD